MTERKLRFEDLPAELDDIGMPHYDRLGQPIGMRRWLVLHNDQDYVRIARDEVGEHTVSTVWVGLPHIRQSIPHLIRMIKEGPHPEDDLSEPDLPLIFETMVLPDCKIYARTATEAEALQAHAEMVTAMRTQLDVFE